jgi:hypothetical protein
MKRLLSHIAFSCLMFVSLQAQSDYRPFKVDVGVLLGEVNEHSVGLIAPYVEPKYNITDKLSVGLRMEYVFYSKEDFIAYNPDYPYFSDFDADGWTFSMALTGDYYFTDHFIRPFIGAGAGIYFMQSSGENPYIPFEEKVVAFGYVPRAGVNIGQFRFSCEYNVIMSEKVDLNYVSLKVGYEIGGKKKWFF